MIQIQTQLARNSTQQTKTRRRRRRGKSLKEINTHTLLETSRRQPCLRPDHIAMLVGLPGEHPLSRDDVQSVWLLRRSKRPRGEHPLSRDDVQSVWLLRRSKRPRVRQPTVLLVHRLPPDG